ncbi:MAG: hypothetical protein ACC645_04680 [Pirellulales bacterium]
MSEKNDAVSELISSLKQQRDELALKIHLGAAEAKQEWEKVTAQLDKLTDDYRPVKDAMAESADNIFESLKLVADEVKSGFDRIRKSL